MVELHLMSLDGVGAQEIDHFRSVLSDRERIAETQYRLPDPRRQFVIARGLARTLMARHQGSAIAGRELHRTAHGKPFVPCFGAETPLFFNVSHCSTMVAVAVSDAAEVGVDVETIRRNVSREALASACMSGSERRMWTRESGEAAAVAFLRYWTLKEACVKTLGVGMHTSLRGIKCHVSDGCDTFAFSYARQGPETPVAMRGWQYVIPTGEVVTLLVASPRPDACYHVRTVELTPVLREKLVASVARPGIGRCRDDDPLDRASP